MVNLMPGMVVKIRNRQWRVDRIYNNELTATNIDGGDISQRRFYIPFEDIEPSVMELPVIDNIGRYADNRLMIEANRLNLIHSTAPLLSLQRSRVIPTTYQLVPLIISLSMKNVRLLLADDVGLGKTIEAGLIITELIARQKIRNFLVVCPASLREQWKDTLSYFFHLECNIISTRHRKELERNLPVGASPWSYYKYLITSMDYVKRPIIKNEILEYDWDLVIIDEAHLVSKPHQMSGNHCVTMDRYEFAKAISKKASNLILATATPHNGYSDSYSSLIQLLDVGATIGDGSELRVIPQIAKKYICQRRRSDVEKWFKDIDTIKSPFPKREQGEVIIDRKADSLESNLLNSIEKYGEYLIDAYSNGTNRSIAYWTVMHFHKRALSSPEALRKSLHNRLTILERRIGKCNEELRGNDEDSNNTFETITQNFIFDNYIAEEITEEEAVTFTEQYLDGDTDKLLAEKVKLKELLNSAQKITAAKDSKLIRLIEDVLPQMFANDGRILIFTKYKDTLDYLEVQLNKRFSKDNIKVITIFGEMNEVKRLEEYRRFSKEEKVVLIATDCISEGINLQSACSQIIHYELPWNPNRLEQRNGRVDRYGQPKNIVHIRTLVVNDSLDTKILSVLVKKSEQIRKDYGFSPPYFGDTNVVLKMLRSNHIDILRPYRQITLFDTNDFINEETFNPFDETVLKKIKSESFYGQTEVNVYDVEKELKETENKTGTKQDLVHFCLSTLNKFGCEYREIRKEVYQIRLQDDDLKVPSMSEKVTFNPVIGLLNPEIEVLDLGHPLVRKMIEKVRNYMYEKKLANGRIAGIYSDKFENVIAVLNILVRYMVNTKPAMVMEEIVPILIDVYNNKLLDEQCFEMLNSSTVKNDISAKDVKETINDLFNDHNFEQYIGQALENKLKNHIVNRRNFSKKISSNENSIEWIDGLEDLSIASKEILTITINYPA